MTDGPDPLRAVQRAAVERAVLGDDAPEHLALAGAVEAASSAGDAPLPALAAVAAVAGLRVRPRESDDRPSAPEPLPSPTSPPSPGPPARSRLRRDGAVVAHRRFDVPLDRAAALADVPPDAVRAHARALEIDD
jgi:hypothetical protein